MVRLDFNVLITGTLFLEGDPGTLNLGVNLWPMHDGMIRRDRTRRNNISSHLVGNGLPRS